MFIKYFTILILLIVVTATSHVDFIIHIPALQPLYMKTVDSKIITFSGGSVIDGILSNP